MRPLRHAAPLLLGVLLAAAPAARAQAPPRADSALARTLLEEAERALARMPAGPERARGWSTAARLHATLGARERALAAAGRAGEEKLGAFMGILDVLDPTTAHRVLLGVAGELPDVRIRDAMLRALIELLPPETPTAVLLEVADSIRDLNERARALGGRSGYNPAPVGAREDSVLRAALRAAAAVPDTFYRWPALLDVLELPARRDPAWAIGAVAAEVPAAARGELLELLAIRARRRSPAAAERRSAAARAAGVPPASPRLAEETLRTLEGDVGDRIAYQDAEGVKALLDELRAMQAPSPPALVLVMAAGLLAPSDPVAARALLEEALRADPHELIRLHAA